MTAKLTIALVAYNEEKFLDKSISSMLAQDYTDFIFRVYNHGSTDSTGAIADNFARHDSRIEVHHLAVNQAMKTHHRVIMETETPFFMGMAGHDYYDPRFLGTCMRSLLEDERIVLSYTRAAFFRDESLTGLIHGHFDIRNMDPMSRSLVVAYGLVYAYQSFGIFRTEALKQLSRHSVVGYDHVLLAELATLGMFAESPEILFFMRQTHDFGDQEAYKKKHHAKDSQDAIVQFLRTMQAYMQIADRFSDDIDKDLMKLAYFTQTLIRNRNILDMYGENVHGFFEAEGIHKLREGVAELVGAIESQFANYGIDTKSSKKE
jgi:hypothetical protein